MNKKYTAASVVLRIWLLTACLFATVVFVFVLQEGDSYASMILLGTFCAALAGSSPVLVALFIFLPLLNRSRLSWRMKFQALLLLQLLLTVPYGIAAAAIGMFKYQFGFGSDGPGFFATMCLVILMLFTCALLASFISLRPSYYYFNKNTTLPASSANVLNQLFFNHFKTTTMYTEQPPLPASTNNKILIKGLVTGALILLLRSKTFVAIRI
jgi:hypothetical protein